MSTARLLGKLLRIVLGRAVGAFAPRTDGGPADPALAARRCRRALAEARADRERRVAELLRYGSARDVLLARVEAEPPGPSRDSLRRSLETLERRLTHWLDELDELDARIDTLKADLALFDALAGNGPERGREREAPRGSAHPAPNPEQARHLAALGLTAMPASLVELKAAYRARLKAVHPDVAAATGAQASTDAAAAATVAFAELRKRFVGA